MPGTQSVDVFLRGGTTTAPGDLHLASGGSIASRVVTNSTNQSEATMVNAPLSTRADEPRGVHLGAADRAADVLGHADDRRVRSFNRSTAYVGALIGDYSPTTSFLRPSRSNEGISNTTTADCWGGDTSGAASECGAPCPSPQVLNDACYLEVQKPTTTINPLTGTGTTGWRITRGILDAVNRDSYFTDSPMTVGQQYELKFPMMPTEYTIPAGHRFAVTLGRRLLGLRHRDHRHADGADHASTRCSARSSSRSWAASRRPRRRARSRTSTARP